MKTYNFTFSEDQLKVIGEALGIDIVAADGEIPDAQVVENELLGLLSGKDDDGDE